METCAFKDKFTETERFSRSLLALGLMESLVTFCGPRNISGAPEQNRGCGILLNDWSRRRLVLFFIPQCWYWIFSIMSHSQDGRKGNICSTYIHPHTDICLLICISLYTHTQKKWHPLSSEPPIPHPKFQFASFLSRRSTCGICFKMTRNKRDLPPEVWDPKLIWKERDLRPF